MNDHHYLVEHWLGEVVELKYHHHPLEEVEEVVAVVELQHCPLVEEVEVAEVVEHLHPLQVEEVEVVVVHWVEKMDAFVLYHVMVIEEELVDLQELKDVQLVAVVVELDFLMVVEVDYDH